MKKYVISLGGSLLYKEDLQLDLEFIKDFCNFIRSFYPNYWFFIIVGGGKLARWFQNQLKEVSDEDLDRVGIKATWLNAEIFKTFLKDIASNEIITNYENFQESEKILIGGGWKPGFSTDFCSVYAAKKLGIKTIINLTRVDGIYINNQLVKEVSARDLLKIVPAWRPGLNFPIDPRALEFIYENELTFIILNGRNFTNLKNCLEGKKFVGTIIK